MGFDWQRTSKNRYAAEYMLWGGPCNVTVYLGHLSWRARKESRWIIYGGNSIDIGVLTEDEAKAFVEAVITLEG